MPGHYGLKKKNGPSKRTAKMSPPAKDSGKRMTPAMKAALKKRLGKK
mgnify:FL=1